MTNDQNLKQKSVEVLDGLHENSPNGAGYASPGQRPGKHDEQKVPALKGRPNSIPRIPFIERDAVMFQKRPVDLRRWCSCCPSMDLKPHVCRSIGLPPEK
jgi:hypothetical protein